MRKVVALMGKNKTGPMLFTENLREPKLQVSGLLGRLRVLQGITQDGVEELHQIEHDGLFCITPARYTKILHDGVSQDILCFVVGS